MPIAEVAAAAALGGACAFAIARLLLANGMVGGAAAASALTCGLVFLLAYAALARFAAGAMHPVTEFVPQPIPGEGEEALGELVLTDANRIDCADESVGELLLDDIVAELRPDARVVRLFDVNAMRALQAGVDRHLTSAPDASEALHRALAELRRSLR